ncbi:hypothetical protein SBRCBS47491_002744 [Sporothrix bragantina]|uniref:Uncharacterized protein n=1 Tax=Sporothrix bragantina TaxID=671064 RepID=A0ABP0B9M3_9PEZI
MRLPNNLRVQTDFGSYNNSQAGPSSRYDQEYERHRSHGHDHGHKHNRRHKHRDERNDRDRHTRHYRLHTPPPVTKGPALPEHMVKHYKLVADKMRSGRHPPMPTYLVGLLSTDKFTQERARSILRGVTCDLMDSLVVLVDKEATRGGERPVDLFKTIEKHFDLQEGQVFKLWAFDSIHDRMPREIKTLRDVLKFIKDRLWAAESLGVASHEHVDPLGELICHFVVETGECHPRLFDVTYEDDEGEEAELKEVKEVECQGDKSKSDTLMS